MLRRRAAQLANPRRAHPPRAHPPRATGSNSGGSGSGSSTSGSGSGGGSGSGSNSLGRRTLLSSVVPVVACSCPGCSRAAASGKQRRASWYDQYFASAMHSR